MVIWLGIFFFLVSFLVIMVLESRTRRVEHEEEDEEVAYSGFDENPREEYFGEEEESKHDSTQKTNKTKRHCGNMFLGLKQGKGVEPLNFTAPIVTILTQVHTPVPESTSVGKGQGMEINK